jgi:nucleotide-binding universal stress UspA family protein
MTCRILVALDGSAASEAALYEVERIAVGGAGVHLLHVVPMLPFSVNATSAGVMAGHDQALTYLGELRARLPDVRGLALIRTGDPAEAILQVTQEFDIELIAMGTQVRPAPAKGVLGSVAETVVRQAQLPVLLKRPGILPARQKLRRILVPLDGSEDSLTILATVMSLGLRTGAEVVFLHVSERALVPLAPRGASGEAGVSGDPKDNLHHATTLDADLIAMTTQPGREMERTVVGSAALAVVERTDRAVLLQRPLAHALVPKAWRYQ